MEAVTVVGLHQVVKKNRNAGTSRAPRVLSEDHQRRVNHNSAMKVTTQEASTQRLVFMAEHRDKLKPFISEEVSDLF